MRQCHNNLNNMNLQPQHRRSGLRSPVVVGCTWTTTTLVMVLQLLWMIPLHATTTTATITTPLMRQRTFRIRPELQQPRRQQCQSSGTVSRIPTSRKTTRIATTTIAAQSLWFCKLRGGSSTSGSGDVDATSTELSHESRSHTNTNIETGTNPQPSTATTSSQQLLPPVTIIVQTNTGSSLIDPIIELPLVNPNKRTILSIKQSIQRQLTATSSSSSAGKPPISTIRLIYQGQILTDDELLLADVLDDEDEDDDDKEDGAPSNDGKQIKMLMDMIPPVDSKNFIHDIESKLADMTTSDLLLAYTTNEASLYYNTQQIQKLTQSTNENDDKEGEDGGDIKTVPEYQTKQQTVPLISVQIRERAKQIQRDLIETILHTAPQRKLLSDPETPNQKELRASSSLSSSSTNDIRGERVRHVGISGIRGNYIRLLQHELNIEDWYKAMKHSLLFLFFGYFGGRTNVSRTILLLGAPLMILIQTRFMKLYLRQILYTVLYNPPSIVLSLLPAPQQAILSLNMSDAMKRIYSKHIILDEQTKQLLKDDPSIDDHRKSDDLSNVLTSKRFTGTVKVPKEADDENEYEEDEEEDDDEEEGDDENDDNDEDE